MTSAGALTLTVLSTFFLTYFFLINSSYLMLIALAGTEFVRMARSAPFAGYREVYASPLTIPISVIMTAHNEEAGIVEAVRAMSSLRYPQLEIVVVDDGSTDRTAELLIEEFDLVPLPRVLPDDLPVNKPVTSIFVPQFSAVPLTLARKENSGRADALNAGLNVARYPLVCMVDADSILDPDALLVVSRPFMFDPSRVVATGGVVRIANGCRIVAGRVVDVRMPRQMLPRIQVVEYLRAFLLGRTGWSRLGSLLIISGAFGVFRREAVVAAGGYDTTSIGEDAELVVRLHRRMRELRRDYRIVFVAEPVSWTECPSTMKVLARQRRRWHRGLTEILLKHRRMVGNPRYGRIGTLGMPYYVVFELFAPLVEISGLVFLVVTLSIGAEQLIYLWQFLLVAYFYGIFVSLAALTIEELAFHRYRRWRDLWWALVASIVENVGFHQITAFWRIQGSWAALSRRRQVWGTMTRRGFEAEPAPLHGNRPA